LEGKFTLENPFWLNPTIWKGKVRVIPETQVFGKIPAFPGLILTLGEIPEKPAAVVLVAQKMALRGPFKPFGIRGPGFGVSKPVGLESRGWVVY